jgi:hypothetical protein
MWCVCDVYNRGDVVEERGRLRCDRCMGLFSKVRHTFSSMRWRERHQSSINRCALLVPQSPCLTCSPFYRILVFTEQLQPPPDKLHSRPAPPADQGRGRQGPRGQARAGGTGAGGGQVRAGEGGLGCGAPVCAFCVCVLCVAAVCGCCVGAMCMWLIWCVDRV